MPAQVPAGPTITLAGEAGYRELANNAYLLNATVTAEFQRIIGTQAAATQAAVMAQQQAVIATQVAEGATATSIYQRAQATQVAANWQATQTAQAFDASIREAAAVSTQVALTAIAYDLDERDNKRQRAAYELEAFKADTASRSVFFGALTLVILASIAAVSSVMIVLIYRAGNIAINRHAVIGASGVAVTDRAGDLVYLPSYHPAMLEAPDDAHEVTHDPAPDYMRIKQPDGAYLPASEAVTLSQERRARAAWVSAAIRFLKWGDALETYSQRAMQEQAGITRADWDAMTAFLANSGFLEKSKSRGWQRVVGDDGERLSMRQVLASRFWSTSFVCPDAVLPEISAPPNVESRAYHDTTHTDTHTHTQPHTGITPENIVEMPDDDEARKRRRYGLMGPMVDFLDENSPTSGVE